MKVAFDESGFDEIDHFHPNFDESVPNRSQPLFHNHVGVICTLAVRTACLTSRVACVRAWCVVRCVWACWCGCVPVRVGESGCARVLVWVRVWVRVWAWVGRGFFLCVFLFPFFSKNIIF